MAAAGVCRTCRLELRDHAQFCDGCGAPVGTAAELAEYKQVTVMFADVVGSMKIAAELGAERLRELMSALFLRCSGVVQRYGGTVDKFTGDGIMAVFGAPVAFEDHAVRACLAALDIQDEIGLLAAELARSDAISLHVRVGLNSGQVIAGAIGSAVAGYTAIGEHVGMAQRMESVAPPGGVMLSESTARLVEEAADLGERESVHIKGNAAPVPARRLLALRSGPARSGRREPTLIGRSREMNALAGMLDQSINGDGCVAGVVGLPGIGKSRLVGEAAKRAAARGVDMFFSFCESHAVEVPFLVVARLLRSVFDIDGIAKDAARGRVRAGVPNVDPDDLVLLEDLLGIGEASTDLPDITPDARKRRLAAMLGAAALARSTPSLYVIEDTHWIDEASESLLAEFLKVVPQAAVLVLMTYRPEYRGALSMTPGAHTIALGPLNSVHTAALTDELLGTHPSVAGLAVQVSERAAGNPFFADEIVRDLAERGVLDGVRGQYVRIDFGADLSVPETLQATLAARIDRLAPLAKHALYAAAVIGARFRPDLLTAIAEDVDDCAAALAELTALELVDLVTSTPSIEFAFRHPLIRTVAYESQLRASRADLHRRVAAAIEQNDPGSADQNAALIAEHLDAAGELRAAFEWHMRAGAWSRHRDRGAARASWQRARRVADQLPAADPDRQAMQIAPLKLLCGTAYLAGGSVVDTGFEELRELCSANGDQVSLAVGMTGLVMALYVHARLDEASQLASELTELVEVIGDSALTVGLLPAACYAKWGAGDMPEAMRLAQRVIDLADGDPTRGNLVYGSPLSAAFAFRGVIRLCLGMTGWRSDADVAVAMAAGIDPTGHVRAIMYKYVLAIPLGALPADEAALQETAGALRIAEQVGDDYALSLARLTNGQVMVHHANSSRAEGFRLLAQAREAAVRERFNMVAIPIVDIEIARDMARRGGFGAAIELMRTVVDDEFGTGRMTWRALGTTVLVESLLDRNGPGDVQEAETAVNRLAAAPTHPGFVLDELPVLELRARLARARGDDA
jgi:class 3 adenylate cyclase